MKKIMLAAVAASFVSTGAQAIQLPAEGEACSTIHSNISVGINNPELSDYRKCVMIQHDIDTAFTYKTFWVRNGTEFTSFPVETLAKMTRGERVDYIKLAIQQGIIIDTLEGELEISKERIIALNAEVKALEAARDALAMAYGDASDAVERLKIDIGLKQIEIDGATNRINSLNETISILGGQINSLSIQVVEQAETSYEQGRRTGFQQATDNAKKAGAKLGSEHGEWASVEKVVEYVYKAGKAAGIASQNLIQAESIDELERQLDEVRAQVTELQTQVASANFDRTQVLGAVTVLATKFLSIEKINELGDITDDVEHVTAVLTAIENVVSNVDRDAIISAAKAAALAGAPADSDGITVLPGRDTINFHTERDQIWSDREMIDVDSSFADAIAAGPQEGLVLYVQEHANSRQSSKLVLDGVIVDSMSNLRTSQYYTANSVQWAQVDGFVSGFDAGYRQGYSDGYDDGYADGYADGFRAGVDSVQ